MHFPTPILWLRFLSIYFLNHCTSARPQGQLDALTQFVPENLPGAAFGTPLLATVDTGSDSNSKTQQTWTEDPELLLLAGVGCNGAAINQNSYPRSRRSFIKGGREVCSPDDKDQILKLAPQVDQGQQPGQGAAQPLLLDPTSVNPDRPEKMKTPPKGILSDASLFYNAIYNIPGEDGQPDDELCALSGSLLLRVPICAPPAMVSPAAIVMPARFCKFSFVNLLLFTATPQTLESWTQKQIIPPTFSPSESKLLRRLKKSPSPHASSK